MEVMGMINNYFWKNKKILLTGHTGFKGSWLLTWLISLGAEVWGFSLDDNESPSLFNSINKKIHQSFNHHLGDIRDIKHLSKYVKSFNPDIVFHLAAQPIVRESYKEPLKTWDTNVMGSLILLESLKVLKNKCAVVMITTDKVYQNKEWIYGYRENDPLGGHDPYSSSKAAAEIAISSWKNSFCGYLDYQTPHLTIATARSGNVIGGGDWAKDRLVPDAIRSLMGKTPILIRNPGATRPWQHVLEPLYGYLLLAEKLFQDNSYAGAYNFGPTFLSNKKVKDLIKSIENIWPGEYIDISNKTSFHEANLLMLDISKSLNLLNWSPIWDFTETIEKTILWYKDVHEGADPYERLLEDLTEFINKT